MIIGFSDLPKTNYQGASTMIIEALTDKIHMLTGVNTVCECYKGLEKARSYKHFL